MKTQICSGGFLMKNNKFLFGKRSLKKTWAPGTWDIIGGKSLKNEHPLLTLHREVFEEVGISVVNAELMVSLDVKDEKQNDSFKYHIYMITNYKGKPINCSAEHTKLRWFDREELNHIAIALPEYLQVIDDWTRRMG